MTELRIPEGTPEWHAIRLRHVGGSEVAALFGVQEDYQQSLWTLHMVKSGRIPAPHVDDAPGTRIWYGKKLEPIIAEMAAQLHGWTVTKGGYCIDDTTPGMGCSLDYVITEPGPEETKLGFSGPGVLQLKNADWLAHKRGWVQDEPPFSVILQLQHEIACSGYGWGVIGCLVGGNNLPAYRYAAAPKIIEGIRDRVTRFWEDVRANRPPHVDDSESTAEAIRALYPSAVSLVPIDMTDNPDFDAICAQFLITRENRRASDKAEQGVKNELEAILQGATLAESLGWRVSVAVVEDKPGRRGSRRLNVTEILRK